MNFTCQNARRLAKILLLSACMVSCDTDASLVSGNDSNEPGDQGRPVGPDQVSELFVLADAVRIIGGLPSSTSGDLKINMRDTVFVMLDFHPGTRVVIKHDGRYDISGVYVGVTGGSFYYDVPVVEEEAQDSTDVIYIGLGDSVDEDVEYPLTIPVKLTPHGPDGTPVDEFERPVTVEDPAEDMTGGRCVITRPRTTAPSFVWDWKYSSGISYSGDLLPIESPDYDKVSSYTTGGCCNADGTSSTVGNDATCHQRSDRFRSINVSHYFRWIFDMLWMYDDGTFKQVNVSEQTNYRPSQSNFCTAVPAYDYDLSRFEKTGTHDFTPGADRLNISYDPTDPPVFGKIIGSGTIKYTCHMLVFEVGREDRWDLVFEKLPDRLVDEDGSSISLKYHD